MAEQLASDSRFCGSNPAKDPLKHQSDTWQKKNHREIIVL